MLQVATPADRWTAKILAYPCFDAPFAQAIFGTRLSNLQVVPAMEVESPGMFAAKAFEWTAKSAREAREVSASRPHMLEQFYILALFEESFGYHMGSPSPAGLQVHRAVPEYE